MTIKEKILEWWIWPEMYYIKRYLHFLRKKEEKYTFQLPNKLLCFWYRGRVTAIAASATPRMAHWRLAITSILDIGGIRIIDNVCG